MSNANWKKFPVLFSLYIAQSIPMSFFSTVVPVIMRQEHYSLQSIGLLQLVKLPWILKFLWAPLVDNSSSNTKQLTKWIIGSELFYAVIIISIGFFDLQTDFTLMIFLIVIAFVASATQDIATDIMAIRVLSKEERSLGNSMQSAGSFLGSLIGTGVLLLAYYYFGWRNLLLLLALFVGFAVIPLLLYKPKINFDKNEQRKVRITDIFLFFKSGICRKHALLLVFYYAGIIGIMAMLKPYMVDLGYDVKQIGFMSGIVGTSIAGLGAFFAGFLIKKIGNKASFYLFAILNILAAVYFYFISGIVPSIMQMYLGIALLWGAYGLSTVIIYTTSMDKVRENMEGTDYTVQIVITHLSSLIIAVLSGKLAHNFGYTGLFKIEILLGIISLLLVFYNYPILRKTNED